MDYLIDVCNGLYGEIEAYGAKNCALCLIACSLLTDEQVTINNCPDIADVTNMLALLQLLGGKVTRNGSTLTVDCSNVTSTVIPQSYAELLRGSVLFAGSILARFKQVSFAYPGGCAIGKRPVDIHLDAFRSLGAEVIEDNGIVNVTCNKLVGTSYDMKFPSVGATENMLMSCVLAEGVTTITNCATEPEVEALERMLVKMGAKIDGIGTSKLVVSGVSKLHGCVFDVIPDRIVTATYIAGVVCAGGSITVTKCCPRHLGAFVDVLRAYHTVSVYEDAIKVTANVHNDGYGRIVTAPYPLFATDMQSLVMSMSAVSNGISVITEKIFENRLTHNAQELNKMGAKCVVTGDTACVVGVGRLRGGTEVTASDLRGGAGLVIASLSCVNPVVVHNVEHINRGYVHLAGALNTLGAHITENGI